MKKLFQIAGLAGVLILSLGGVVWLVQQRMSSLATAHIILGAALLLIGIAANIAPILEFLKKRAARMGPQAFVQGVILLAILVLVNIVVMNNNWIKDFTRLRLYELRRATLEVCENLPADVEMLAFFPGGSAREARQRLLLYDGTFDRVRTRFIDPDKNEDIARAENVPPYAGVLVKSGDNRVYITNYEESDITNAIIKVSRSITPKALFTTGHGEAVLDSDGPNGMGALQGMLEDQGFETEQVDLATIDRIPEDVDVVAVIGPNQYFKDRDVEMLDYFMQRGGNALFMLDPVWELAAISGLEDRLIRNYGVTFYWNTLFEPEKKMAGDKLGVWMVIEDFKPHEITDGLSGKRGVFYLARGLDENAAGLRNSTATKLATSSAESYEKVPDIRSTAEMSTAEEYEAYVKEFLEREKNENEAVGAFALCYAVEKRHKNPMWERGENKGRRLKTRMVVYGTSTPARNITASMPYNYELMMNTFNWLSGEENLTFMKAPERTGSRIDLEQSQKDIILYVSVMILPEVFMIMGLAVWWRRR